MTWKLTAWGQTRMPLPGVPWGDMTDEEFATAAERYPELAERGYFEHDDEAPERPARRGRAPEPEVAADTPEAEEVSGD